MYTMGRDLLPPKYLVKLGEKKKQAIIDTQEVCVCEGRWPEEVKADFMFLILGPWVAWKPDSTGR